MLSYHATLLADEVRTKAFLDALAEIVRPGMRVLDIGTGTGILALAAERLGADVVAVEEGDMIDCARAVARANNSRIRFIHRNFAKVAQDEIEPVDVVVSEMLGNMLFDEEIIPVMDAARRFLKPGGVVIPSSARMSVALAYSDKIEQAMAFWKRDLYGFDFTPLAGCMENYAFPDYLKPVPILGPGADLPDVDFHTVTGSRFDAEATLTATSDGECNAVLAWWSSRLSPSVSITMEPHVNWPKQHWFRTLFPVDPVRVASGDTFRFSISHDAVVSRGIWAWSFNGRHRSTFFAFPQTRERLQRLAEK